MANGTLLDELFLRWPTGEVFLDDWGGAASPWWNFSSAAATQFWIEQGPIAQAMADPLLDGVYLDGADMGDRHGVGVSAWTCGVFASPAQQARYIADSQAALAQAVSYWREQQPQKMLTGYVVSRFIDQGRSRPNDEAFHCPSGACAGPTQLAPAKGRRGPTPNRLCATTMRGLIARSTWANQTMMLEPAPLAEMVCPGGLNWSKPVSSWDCHLAGFVDPAPYVAAFLVGRGPSAVLQLAVQPMLIADWAARFASLRSEPGRPLGVATEVAPGVFVREFEKMDVRFDCANLSASALTLKGDP